MNKFNRFLVGAGVTLVLGAAPVAQAAADTQSSVPATETEINRATPDAEVLLLDLNFKNANVVDALKTISKLGNIEIIVRGSVHGKLENMHMEAVPPEQALEKVCTAANLTWALQNKIYVISAKSPEDSSSAQKDARLTIVFEEVAVADLLDLIAKQGDIHVVMGHTVSGERLNYLHLNNETVEGAIQKISQAAGLIWKKLDDKTYSVAKPE